MAEDDKVILRLQAEVAQYRRDILATTTLVDSSLRKQGNAVQSLEQQMSRSSGVISSSLGLLKGALAGVSAVALARAFLDMADASKSLEAQLRLATAGFGSFAQAQEDVRRISANARAGLEDTASLYGSFSRRSSELGRSQEEAAQATETFTKALKVGGAGTQQVQSATLQMGQALASTNVQWEELGQILEASPRLARVFTDSLGITRQELKKMAEDGKLTGEMLFNALNDKSITRGIDAEFAQLPVTFDEAMTSVNNAAITTFGAFDRGGQFSTALANFITQGADGFGDLEQDALDLGVSVRSSLEGLGDVFDPLFQAAKTTFAFIRESASEVSDYLKQKTGASIGVEGLLYNIDGAVSLSGYDPNLLGKYRKSRDASANRLRNEMAERSTADLANTYFDRFGNPLQRNVPKAAGPSDSDQKKAAAAQRKAEAEARKAEQDRLRAIRDDASKARDAARLQDDVNAAKAALATATEDVLAYNLQAIDSDERQRLAEYETQRKLGRISEQELAERTAAVKEIAELQRERAQRIADESNRRDNLERYNASLQDNSDLLRAQADLVATRQERRDIELRLLDLSYEQERAELEAVTNSNTASDAQKEIAEQRLRILDQLKGYDAERIGRQYESPLEQRRREARDTAANMGDAIENIQIDAVDRLGDSIANATQEYIKLGGVAGDVINSIISDLIKLQIKQAIFGSAGGGLFSMFGLGGGSKLSGVNYGALASAANSVKIPGFASGTNYAPGGVALVGEEGPELVQLPRGSKVIPNHQLNARAAASMVGVTAASPVSQQVNGVVRVAITMDNDVFTARVQEASVPVAVEVVRQNARGLVDTAKAETIRDLNRQRL